MRLWRPVLYCDRHSIEYTNGGLPPTAMTEVVVRRRGGENLWRGCSIRRCPVLEGIRLRILG